MSTALYCPVHKAVEKLSGRQLEDLVSGMRFELAGATADPVDPYDSWTVDELLDRWCPAELVTKYREDELLADFLVDARGERLAVAKRAREEYRRVGGGEAPRYALPNPRGDGIRRAADLIRAGAPVGQIAAVVRDAMAAHVKPLLDKMQPASQVTVTRTLSVFPEAVELAGQVVELPPPPTRAPIPAHLDEDLINREAGLPARERRHRGIPTQVGFSQQCSVCEWSPTGTAHVRTEREAAQAIRRAHNPMGKGRLMTTEAEADVRPCSCGGEHTEPNHSDVLDGPLPDAAAHTVSVEPREGQPAVVTFNCSGNTTSSCHQYSACGCEHITGDHLLNHPAVAQEKCWMAEWFNVGEGAIAYLGDDDDGNGWPTAANAGPIAVTVEDECLLWEWAA